jgi:hypothetical protein
MHEWNDFYLASAGAAAALAGLIFVGISINLAHILIFPNLVLKASVALILLVAILIFSILLLIPQDNGQLTGCEIIGLGLLVWTVITKADQKIYGRSLKEFKRVYLYNLLFDQLTVLCYIIAGLHIFLWGSAGLFWMVPAMMLSFIKSVFDAWVLLIEIKR